MESYYENLDFATEFASQRRNPNSVAAPPTDQQPKQQFKQGEGARAEEEVQLVPPLVDVVHVDALGREVDAAAAPDAGRLLHHQPSCHSGSESPTGTV